MITKKKIISYLDNRGDYNDMFEMHVDRLLNSIKIAAKAEKDILDNGVRVNVSKAETPVYQLNHSVGALQSANKDIRAYSKLLGLSPFDLKELEFESGLDESFDDD
ncbi:P27 family phage terminase small subunit [Labilibacter sediminis]|nr:P27 family phage terminase small subunit [Labilibacter sediminis]